MTLILLKITAQDQKKNNMEAINCDTLANMLDTEIHLPETIEQIIGYISGFVAKKINNKVNCNYCRVNLFAKEKYYFHKLICLKDFGGLAYPSAAIFKICLKSECVLRKIIKIEKAKSMGNNNNLSFIASRCFSYVSSFSDILNSFENNYCDHYILMIKSIIEHFLIIRLHYIARNESLLHSSRQKFNKLTLFRGT